MAANNAAHDQKLAHAEDKLTAVVDGQFKVVSTFFDKLDAKIDAQLIKIDIAEEKFEILDRAITKNQETDK